MAKLLRHWPFSRVTTTILVLPLVVVCCFAATALTIGNPKVGKNLLVVCGGAILVVYFAGMAGIRLYGAITPANDRRPLHRDIAIIMGLVIWGVAAFGIIFIPAAPYADFDRLFQRSPDESIARTSFENLGASLLFDRHGRIIMLELHDASDDALSPLRDLHHVRGLTLDGSPITDAAMAQFGHLRTLEYLELAGTGVTDESLLFVSRFPCLQSLNLSDTIITDVGLQQLSQLSGLENLWVSRTKISDSGMSQLGKLRALRRLHLDGTSVSNKGLLRLVGLRKLEVLSVRGTGVTAEDAYAFEKAIPGCTVHFGAAGPAPASNP